ncbi:MAG TPA: sigma-70 family RNA polymerase sigma factor, partial [Alphaproteobacteria bacterium]|nr:sigma-70 family RNA polymerase sigma factor [Alphaproteobacteria bacterium]
LPLSKPQRKILVTILRARGETLSQYILAEGLYGPLGGGMLKYVRQYISDMRRQLRTVGLDEQIVEAITSGEHLAEYRIQISKIPEKTFEPFFKEKNECFLEWRRMAALQLAQARTNVKESAIAAETASDPQVAIHAAAVQPVAPSNAQAPGTGSENPSKSSERLAAEKEKRQFFERQIPSLIPRLRRYALARTRDSDKTDDLVQEALTRGLARLHLWRDGTSLEAWLITILRNEYVNGVRQAVRRGQSIPVEDVESSFAVAGNQLMTVQLKEVRRYLAELPEEQRDVILLVGQEGMSHEHVAEVLGVAVGTVCSRLFRGREQLSQLTAYGRETKHSGKISSRPEVTVEDRMSTEEAVTYGAVSVHPGFNNTIDWERLSVDDHFLWQSYVAEKPSAGRPRELVPA